jgi:hypothetical protein
VAHVAEERRLRAIDLRQRLGPTLRVLKRYGIADGRRNVIGRQLKETPI